MSERLRNFQAGPTPWEVGMPACDCEGHGQLQKKLCISVVYIHIHTYMIIYVPHKINVNGFLRRLHTNRRVAVDHHVVFEHPMAARCLPA